MRRRSPEYGKTFEAYVHHELRCYCDYHSIKTLHFWRSQGKNPYEIGFILDQSLGIEVKAKEAISKKDLRGVYALREEGLLKKYIVVSLEPKIREVEEDVIILPYQIFLDRLWAGNLY